jgi:hypothetical protein
MPVCIGGAGCLEMGGVTQIPKKSQISKCQKGGRGSVLLGFCLWMSGFFWDLGFARAEGCYFLSSGFAMEVRISVSDWMFCIL